MAQIIEKVVKSAYPPEQTEVLWLDTNDNSLKTFTSNGWDKVKSGSNEPNKMIDINWVDLKILRDNSKLIPEQQYRITDYVTTAILENIRSAGHPFDIIVTADDESTLNENAMAIQHEGDTYFANSDLSAWQLWYCLDNDKSRFAWADTTNGKGVIYRMIDEFNNDCSYDFKNIQFKRYNVSGFTLIKTDNHDDNFIESKKMWFDSYTGTLPYKFYTGYSTLMSAEYIEEIAMEYGWQINVDPKLTYCRIDNPSMDDESTTALIASFNKETIAYEWFYTFTNRINSIDGYINSDKSLTAGRCFNNIIKGLNNIFINSEESSNCYKNTLTGGDNTFGDNCYNNTFGNWCTGNTFGHHCYGNTFGSGCDYNIYTSLCRYNTFGSNCDSNIIGQSSMGVDGNGSCSNNIFANKCSFNTFKGDCGSNTFGNDCSSNTFWDYCNNNTLRDESSSNTFSDNCSENTLGNKCSHNTFDFNCSENTLGNNCSSNTFGRYCNYNTFENNCNNIHIQKDYVWYIIIESENKGINITSTQTTSSSQLLRNFTITHRVNNSYDYKTISHNTTNDTFNTTYQPVNSVVVSI